MSRNAALLVSALLLLAPSPAGAQRNVAAVTEIADDSLVTRIVGIYRSDADPNGHVSISSHGRGVVAVTWDAIGFWDGLEFRGVARTPFYGVTRVRGSGPMGT